MFSSPPLLTRPPPSPRSSLSTRVYKIKNFSSRRLYKLKAKICGHAVHTYNDKIDAEIPDFIFFSYLELNVAKVKNGGNGGEDVCPLLGADAHILQPAAQRTKILIIKMSLSAALSVCAIYILCMD